MKKRFQISIKSRFRDEGDKEFHNLSHNDILILLEELYLDGEVGGLDTGELEALIQYLIKDKDDHDVHFLESTKRVRRNFIGKLKHEEDTKLNGA